MVAEEGHPHDLAEGHAVQHERRLEHSRHAVRHVRVEEGGVVGGDEDVRLAEQVEGAPAGHAVDGGDHRLPAVVAARSEPAARIRIGQGVEAVLDPLVGRDLGAIDARAKSLVTGCGDDHRPHVVVVTHVGPRRRHLVAHGGREGVVPIGPIQRDGRHAVGHLVPDRAE